MRFTNEQQAAIGLHDRDVIVTAGAGSGKTRVLVARYMALLRANPAWPLPSLVAITFTEKAAREMRDRVRSAIEDEIRQAADGEDRDRWIARQADLNSARIGTIHGLCAQILRGNPAEAAVDPGFEVLDENEAMLLRHDAVREALARLGGSDDPAVELLVSYDVWRVGDVLRSALAGDIRFDEIMDADDRRASWAEMWQTATRDVMAAARSDGALQAALDWQPDVPWPSGDKLMANWELVHDHTGALRGEDPAAFGAAVMALREGIKLTGGKQDAWGGADGKRASSETLKTIREWAKAVDLYQPLGPPDDEAARLLVLWQAAINRAAAVYTAMKQARGALDFNDLERRAADLLADHAAVRARYAQEFRQVLVDEFQDTNATQRAIIDAISGFGAGEAGRLFVVGDPKQSIYGFRGADVRVFGQVHRDIVDAGGADLPLSESFRTHRNLVMLCNTLFERILNVDGGPAAAYQVALGTPMRAYRPSEETLPTHHAPLLLNVIRDPADDAGVKLGADDRRRWEAWTLAQRIHQMVRNRVPVWDRDLDHDQPPEGAIIPDAARDAGRGGYRPLGYGDVAFLFQSTGSLPLYEDVFKAAGLPYLTTAGRGYYDRQEVWDLLNLLRAVYRPYDDLSLAAVLRSPLFGISDDGLLALRRARDAESGQPLTLWAALFADVPGGWPSSDDAARVFAQRVLGELHAVAGRATIAELLGLALERTGCLAALSGLAGGARRRGNVEKLVQLAEASGRVGLGAFLDYAQNLSVREVREGEAAIEAADAVKLMTVHHAKGLEFPVVGLPDASWGRRADAPPVRWDPQVGLVCRLPDDASGDKPDDPFAYTYARDLAEAREAAERKRLLYVAATRAQDYLLISGSWGSRMPRLNWLAMVLDTLGIAPDDLSAGPDLQPHSFEGLTCCVHVPDQPPDPADLIPRAPAASGWDDPSIAAGEPVPGVEPALPPLLADVPHDATAPLRALTATHIARLGEAPFYDPPLEGFRRFRQAVLHDAPDPLRPLPPRAIPDDQRGKLARIVGDMVHRALKNWLLPGVVADDHLREMLRVFAWENHLSAPDQVAQAEREALRLLERFAQGRVRAMLEEADEVYREVPFVFSTGRRTIHGVIDVLYRRLRQRRGGQWYVLDYKSSLVSWQMKTIKQHAARYYLQLGVYAAAVEELTGQKPIALLYYIHPARLLRVSAADWQPALDALEDDVRRAILGQTAFRPGSPDADWQDEA